MNQGGQFAQNLSVYIGGGQGATTALANTNGSIQLDLSKATVDAQSPLKTTFTGGAALSSPVASQATTINVQFQGAGMTQPATVAVKVTAQETLANVLTSLTSLVANNSTLAKAGITVDTAASISGNSLTFQSASGQQFSVAAGGDLDNLLGLGSTRMGGTPNTTQTVQYAQIAGKKQGLDRPAG